MIPLQLQKKGFRFIKVRTDKSPEEKEWTTNNNHSFDDENFLKYIEENKRYGVVTGFKNLVVIDFDNETVQEDVIKKLPKTFSVRTAGKGLLHLYYFVDKPESFKILNLNKDTLVDVQGQGKQVIGAGTVFNGREYEIIDDIDIATVPMRTIQRVLSKWIILDKINEKVKAKENKVETDMDCKLIKEKIKLPIILSKYKVDTSKNPTKCPFHDSQGGRCFSFNDEVWHCFHCEESGNVFHFMMKVLDLPFIDVKNQLLIMAKVDYSEEKPEKAIEYKYMPEILNNPIAEPKWQVEGLVPESGITYLAAQPGEGKTMLCLYMAQCIASGKDFLGKKVLPGKVIYFDAENGEICIYNRVKRIAEGHDFLDDELKNMAISIFPNIRFNIRDASYNDFNAFCEDFQPDVIIFDSLVRYMDGSENDAETCKMVFDYLRSWLKKDPNLTIIILHHLSKHNAGGMNALRGSSEIAASASSILLLKRVSNSYKLEIEKSRFLDMSKAQAIFYNLTDTENGLFFELCEQTDMPSDAVGRAYQDFCEWVNEDNIKTFYSKDCQTKLQTKGHSKDAIYKMITTLIKDEEISKLRRGKYEVKEVVIMTEEVIE